MTGAFKAALTLSVGIHAGVFVGWPTTATVEFDVERASASFEIRLVAPPTTTMPAAAQPVSAQPIAQVEPEPAPIVQHVQEPGPVPETVVLPESQGALGEVLPGYLRNPAPRYPLWARQRGEAGLVMLNVEVLPSGRCGRLTVRSSSGFRLLDEAAEAAVKRWQFKPARREGQPVGVWVEIPIRFQLVDVGG